MIQVQELCVLPEECVFDVLIDFTAGLDTAQLINQVDLSRLLGIWDILIRVLGDILLKGEAIILLELPLG